MSPADAEERKHQATLLARDVRNAEVTRDMAAQNVENIKTTLADLKARLPLAKSDLAAAEQGVLDAQATRTRWNEQQTIEFRLKRAREAQEGAIRQARERAANAEANLAHAQEERIIAAEGLAAIIQKDLQP